MTSPDVDVPVHASARAARILVVDDEPAVRASIARGLIQRRYDVTSAESGEEALEVVERASRRFDVVIADIMMGGMSGVALAERLRLRDDHLRVILISGFPGGYLSDDTMPIASYDFLEKPFSPAQLAALVRGTARSMTAYSDPGRLQHVDH